MTAPSRPIRRKRDSGTGVTASQLVAQGGYEIEPRELKTWLLAEGLAETRGLELVPTARALDLTTALDPRD